MERRIWKEPKIYTLRYFAGDDNYFERTFRRRYWKKKEEAFLKQFAKEESKND